jgi:hypothetical protein
MHLIYIDESKDTASAPHQFVYTALCVEASIWRSAYEHIRTYRQHLRATRGIFLKTELHAWKFVAGKGQIANRPIYKPERADIFMETIRFIADMGGHADKVCLFNSINKNEEWAFERLINRINRTMENWDSQAILLFDEGEEVTFRKRIRRMKVYNPIPSQTGSWQGTGMPYKNITINRIIEDPLFKQSHESNFIQLVDFCAYALLRQEKPVASKTALGIDQAFRMLDPICFKPASPKDVMGVIR